MAALWDAVKRKTEGTLQKMLEAGLGTANNVAPHMVQKTIKIILQKLYLDRYGEIMDLHLDSDKKTITASVLLKGEVKNIDLSCSYSVKETKDGLLITIQDLITSREWLTLIVDEVTKDKPLKLPKYLRSIL